MFRYKLIRTLLVISLAIAVLLPGYDFIFVHPAYQELITEKTESEAVRYASYMVRTLGLENQFLSKDTLPADLADRLKPVGRDQQLIKLRIFAVNGEIIFSSQAAEIGTVNERDYFHNIVAKGEVYSKIVKKDRQTAEGVVTLRDVVETYVPFMVAGQFGGAFEVYYDVTESVGKVRSISWHSHTAIVLLTLGFLLAIFIALYRAYISLQERDAAEEALKRANEDLERRVAERTRELVDANELLTEQIAERIRAQDALAKIMEEIRVDREKLDQILQSVPDGVVVANGALQVLHMNSAAESILGTTLDDVLGESISKLSHNVDFIKKVGQRLNLTHIPQSFDFELACDEHKTCVYQVRISQFLSDETESPGVVLLIRDVTREREIERMKSAFLGMAAHELNTPLTTIIGYTELLTDKETAGNFDSKQQKDCLRLIHDKALALGGLIDDLLDISRVESGRPLFLNIQEFDLNELIRNVSAPYQAKSPADRFELTLLEGGAPICADRVRVEQVVSHLVSNAVKYSPGGGPIQLCLDVSDDQYALSVVDQGIGMNAEQLEHIFDRFYRADATDTAVQGVGLGMSIVRHIVLAHHGEVKVESQPGQGTRVLVTLPKLPPQGTTDSRQPFKS